MSQIPESNAGPRADESESHETSTKTRVVFGSCHKSTKAAVPSIWETILETEDSGDETHRMDAFVWTGDAVYTKSRHPVTGKRRYGPAPPLEVQQAFDDMKTNTTIGYTRLLERNIPIYGKCSKIWNPRANPQSQ